MLPIKNSTGRRFVFILPALIVVGLLVAGYIFYPTYVELYTTKQKYAVSSIAVLPFINMSNDSTQDYLCDGLTDGILNSLAQLKGLKVSARNSSFKFGGKNVDIKDVGKKLNVQTVLEGSVQIDGDRIRITAQLINVEDEFHFWSEQYDEKLEDVFAIQDKVANAISEKLEIAVLVSERNKTIKKPMVEKRAYDLYLKARSHWNLRTPADLKQGIALFEQAIAIDSSYAAAYSGLADSYNALGYGSYVAPEQTFPKAQEAARKAIQLDSTLAEPHASLGFFNFYYGWDWDAAEQEFRTAIALNPNYALAYDWYGYYLTAMQRYDEAIVVLQKAIELDPLSDPIQTDIGFSLYYGGKYEQAVEKLLITTTSRPRFGPAHLWLGRSYQQQKKYEQAIQEYKTVLKINANWPVALAALGNVYGVSGQQDKAQNILDTLRALSSKKFVTPYGMALVYNGLGKKDEALSLLYKAYEGRSNWLVWLKSDPRLQSIHTEKQFVELVNKVGLPR